MSDDLLTVEGVKPLIERMTRRYSQRLYAFKIKTIEIEDLRSEIWIAWTMACANFDASKGVPFAAYLQLGVQHHINAILNKETRSASLCPLSLNYENASEEGDGVEFGDTIADDTVHPIERLIEEENWNRVMRKVSPAARQVLELLRAPPPELYVELEAQRARATYARSRGIQATTSNSVTLSMLLEFLCFSRPQRTKFYAEIERATRR